MTAFSPNATRMKPERISHIANGSRSEKLSRQELEIDGENGQTSITLTANFRKILRKFAVGYACLAEEQTSQAAMIGFSVLIRFLGKPPPVPLVTNSALPSPRVPPVHRGPSARWTRNHD